MLISHRSKATIIGFFYILAFVSSVLAVLLYEPIMAKNWFETVPNNQENTVLLGVVMDLLLLVSAIATTSFLAPYLAKTDKQFAVAYFAGRFMEAVFIGIGLLSVLVLVSLSQAYSSELVNDINSLQVAGLAWQNVHRWIMVLGPNLMLGLNTGIYAILLKRSKLIPSKLAIFGIITAIMVLVAGFLDMFGVIEPWSTMKGLISLPIGVFEMSLALYLIVKGFRSEGLK